MSLYRAMQLVPPERWTPEAQQHTRPYYTRLVAAGLVDAMVRSGSFILTEGPAPARPGSILLQMDAAFLKPDALIDLLAERADAAKAAQSRVVTAIEQMLRSEDWHPLKRHGIELALAAARAVEV